MASTCDVWVEAAAFSCGRRGAPCVGVPSGRPHSIHSRRLTTKIGALGILQVPLALLLPAFRKQASALVPIAAAVIAAEMVLDAALHLSSGHRDLGPVAYWLVVAALCGVLALGRRPAA